MIEVLLDQHNLKKFIENELTTMCTGKLSNEQNKLNKEEKECKALLINHVSNDQLEHIKDQGSARGIIDTLKSVFERKTISRQLFIRKKLLTTKYHESEDMEHYLLQFDRLIRELKESGPNIDSTDIICHLLVSLSTFVKLL